MSDGTERFRIHSQAELRAMMESQRLAYEWPTPVHVVARGYLGDGGRTWLLRMSLREFVGTTSTFPGIDRWAARAIVLIGRSDTEFVAMRPRSATELRGVRTPELWRSPIASANPTGRTVGRGAIVDFGGHPVWLLADRIDALLGKEG